MTALHRVVRMIGEGLANDSADSSLTAANADGSILERLEYIQANFVPTVVRKTITFAAGAGTGDVGTVAVATVTGRVLVAHCSAFCSTDLTGASATVEMGVASDTAGLLPQITATTLDANEFWEATPSPIAASVTDKVVKGNIIITVGTAGVTGGVIEVVLHYLPLSADGAIVAA